MLQEKFYYKQYLKNETTQGEIINGKYPLYNDNIKR